MTGSDPSIHKWSVAPAQFALEAGDVHVWLVRACDPGLCLVCCENLLAAAERERAARFKFEEHRRLYVAAHAGLRSILAGYLNVAPGKLEFEIGRRGKPRLVPPPNGGNVAFNLSHSHEVALVAVTRESEIGVDVERIREDFAFAELAERYFTAAEVGAIRALPEGLQRRAFYQCWTSKEAVMKAKGVGLSGELDEVEIVLGGDGRVRVKSGLPGWCLNEFDPCDGYAGAMALAGTEIDLRCYEWPSPVPGSSHSHL